MRILVVDDSKAMRMIIKRTLRQAGYGDCPVDEAGNGIEALSVIDSNKPDLILADWNMPEMNGLELLEKLKSQGVNVPFIFVTSEGTDEMKQIAHDAGAISLISKPFTADHFQRALTPVIS